MKIFRFILVNALLILFLALPIFVVGCAVHPENQFSTAHQESYDFLQSELRKSQPHTNTQPYADFTVLRRHDGSRIGCDAIMSDLGAAAEPDNYNFSEVQRLKTEYNTYCRQWR
jgi:hypothetical protein